MRNIAALLRLHALVGELGTGGKSSRAKFASRMKSQRIQVRTASKDLGSQSSTGCHIQ